MKNKLYAIIDIETTGGRANRDRITEIAIVLHDGQKIVDQWETLINPERAIPYNITQITGITQEMVVNAPRFFEVAKKIVEMTTGTIFVAHNVRFDYSFIKEEFKRLGFTFTRRQLCTVRLSRKAFPGLPSYSLGNLIKFFGIKVDQRHRAMADTQATTTLLEMILEKENSQDNINDLVNLGVRQAQLPASISLETLHELPEECGVYYFYNKDKDIIYVGKSINIKKRVMEHFAKQTEKARKLHEAVSDISYEVMGSELVALLFESHEIKTHHPRINRAQRARSFPYVIFSYHNEEGYLCLKTGRMTAKEKKTKNVLRSFPKLSAVKGLLNRMLEEFELCQTYCSVDHLGKPCFYYHIHKCKGACIGKESPEEYNARVHEALETLSFDFRENFILLDKGRHPKEKAVVLVEDGQYCGFGYAEQDNDMNNIEALKDVIKPYAHNPDVIRIIRQFLYGEKKLEIIRF